MTGGGSGSEPEVTRVRGLVDVRLAQLVRRAEMGESMDLTLLVSGAVVSGRLIGVDEWARLVAAGLADRGPEMAEAARAVEDSLAERRAETMERRASEVDDDAVVPALVHLDRVEMVAGGHRMTFGATPIALRLADVQAWAPGVPAPARDPS